MARHWLLAAALAAALLAAPAWAGPRLVPSAPAFPVTVVAANGTVTIDKRPARIVSLTATATETLFAIGAGKQVVAADNQSNFPPTAPTTTLSATRPNAEAIAGYQPDLVVVSSNPAGIVEALGKLGIPVILAPPAVNLSQAYAQMQLLARATGHVAGARALIRSMRARILKTVASVPKRGRQLTVYTELSPSLFSASSRTFIGQVLDLFGLRNIADDAPAASGDYPKLSNEFILAANPDLILLADGNCCAQTAATVAARVGWSGVAAVRNGNVVSISDDIASRWGPRIVSFIALVADEVKAARR